MNFNILSLKAIDILIFVPVVSNDIGSSIACVGGFYTKPLTSSGVI